MGGVRPDLRLQLSLLRLVVGGQVTYMSVGAGWPAFDICIRIARNRTAAFHAFILDRARMEAHTESLR